jgi:hypothetical protein
LIVDVVDDDYECFKRQFYGRNRYYRKSGIGQVQMEIEEEDDTQEYDFVFAPEEENHQCV